MIIMQKDLVTHTKDLSEDEIERFMVAFECEATKLLNKLGAQFGFTVLMQDSK